ncbi:aminotransferase class IV [Marinobacter sp. CHS3-4]|nr:aminotransferase class IV [Marinobacter sp. CHS3-4]MDI9245801.1 aminotransferase class IV [Marinobacter sp. CHS3-4]
MKVLFADKDPIQATDRGFAYGDGLFETVRMVGQKAVLRQLHLNRMVTDALRLGIPISHAELDTALSQAAQRFSGQRSSDTSGNWILKMILTRGSGGRGYRPPVSVEPKLIVSASTFPPLPDPDGVVAGFASIPLMVNPHLAGIKSLNRLEQVMASQEFTEDDWELIMKDRSGDLVEGTRTNLMARLGEEWVTPPVGSIAVSGVMRQYAMECLKKAGEQVAERPLPADLASMPEFRGLYLLNSVFGVVPVRILERVNLPVDGTLATIANPLETLE